MRSGFRIVALFLLLAALAGCGLRHKAAPPPLVAQAPSRPPAEMASLIPLMPPQLPAANTVPVKLDTTAPPEERTRTAAAKPPHPVRHRSRPSSQEAAKEAEKNAAETAQTPPSPEIASSQPSEASPIGQLSTASDNTNTADRHAISDLIDSTENGLNAIRRPLSSDEQKTAAQIRTFITRARAALKADDLDGARTLSTKAHLLLQELLKQQ